MSCEVVEGDIGTVFTATIKDCDGTAIDVSGADGASDKKFSFKPPTSAASTDLITVNASFVTDGVDGQITYTVTNADGILDEPGVWQIEANIIITATTDEWKTETKTFEVKEALA